MDDERIITTRELKDDGILDNTIRPESIVEYIGQRDVKENIKVYIEAAKMRNETLDQFYYMVLQGLVKRLWLILLLMN